MGYCHNLGCSHWILSRIFALPRDFVELDTVRKNNKCGILSCCIITCSTPQTNNTHISAVYLLKSSSVSQPRAAHYWFVLLCWRLWILISEEKEKWRQARPKSSSTAVLIRPTPAPVWHLLLVLSCRNNSLNEAAGTGCLIPNKPERSECKQLRSRAVKKL